MKMCGEEKVEDEGVRDVRVWKDEGVRDMRVWGCKV